MNLLLVLALMFGSLSKLEHVNQPVRAWWGYNIEGEAKEGVIWVSSDYQIKDIVVINAVNRYSFFVEYSGNKRNAKVLIRTDEDPLEIRVRVIAGEDVFISSYSFKIKNFSANKFSINKNR